MEDFFRMSSTEQEPQVTITQTEVSISQTEVTGPKTDAEHISAEIASDLNKISKTALKSLDGFRAFILRGNVIDLAIGIVIGAAFTSVVTSLVGDVITPLIPLPGKNSLGLLTIPLPAFYPKGAVIHIGSFINAIISFLIVAAVLYFFVVQPVNSLMKLYKPKEAPAPDMRDCPYCFQAVVAKATRCPYCTSHLPNASGDAIHHAEEQGPALVLPDSLESLSDKLAEKIVKKAKLENVVSGGASSTTTTATEESTTEESTPAE
jgi:large conductance mechanosensitive channel